MSAFDLDQFAPAPTRFTLGGREYRVDGDPDVDVVARMLRIEEKIGGGTDASTVAALEEGRDLLLELIREYDDGVESIRIGVAQLLTVFALIVHGDSVAAAVQKAIAQQSIPADPAAAAEPGSDEGVGGEELTEDAPLASASSSPARSSSSDAETAGALVTGTA